MKFAICMLVVGSVAASSLALPWPIPTKKSKLTEVEEKLGEIEAVLNELQDKPAAPRGGHGYMNNTQTIIMEEILLHTDNIDTATTEIESAGGRVTMQMGDDLLVAKVPANFITTRKNFASASAHISASASPETLLFVQAYYKAREKKARPAPPVQRWTEKTAPAVYPRKDPLPDEANSPYRNTMTGKIAFLAIVISGPGKLKISDAENSNVISQVSAGLKFWADTAPKSANLKFSIYTTFVSITAADSTSCPKEATEDCHNVFVDPALQALGADTGQMGKDQIAQYIKGDSGADGAYIGFFSKYKQSHFAYAYFGGGPLYMQYSNDGWGPDQIDRVFAHETGHVFNAPDEYVACKCSKGYGQGTCTAWNGNCKDCTSSQTSCIMDSNDFSVCSYTKKHLGWCN